MRAAQPGQTVEVWPGQRTTVFGVIEDSSDVTVTDGRISGAQAATAGIKGDSHRVTVSGLMARGYAEVFAVRAGAKTGYGGLRIETRDGKAVTAWAVQKSNLANWRGRHTRADDVAATIRKASRPRTKAPAELSPLRQAAAGPVPGVVRGMRDKHGR
ncbi:hypothetical protein AB0J74_20230 [Asanoa sp. NPDC049573]|uniref:hypothetical protein n=1 Tax=Asanoa sp. NPDC049573 TaxID=3155396 RepID=UPI0034347830